MPSSDHWRRARDLFDDLVDLGPPQRRARVEALREKDPELAETVEDLLRHEEGAGDFLEASPADTLAPLEPGVEGWVGRRLGSYLILREIASGGMGTVFEAEQEKPRRRVALKTLRLGRTTSDSRRRFQMEVEILGRLQHPGIAQIHEAGVLDVDGLELPFLAMELVENARDLVRYAKEEKLATRRRVELLRDVCDAVRVGHQKGVIHRDLKPGNVLVDEHGRVKVIDFGLARVVEDGMLDVSRAETIEGGVLGTLVYMSPEHVTGRSFEIDTRSDVYSLGCILFELLADRPPREFDGLSTTAALHRIHTEEPRIPPELRRELRWVLQRALDREPDRRYASAAEFSADLGRFLRNEPLEASEPGALYRLSKFVRRNRVPVAATLAVFAALLIGLERSRAHAKRADAAKNEANQQAHLSRSISGFLAKMFISMSVYRLGPEAKVRDQLEDAAERLAGIEDRAVRGVLQGIVGEGYLGIDELERARELLEGAAPLVRAEFPLEAPERLHFEVVYADYLERTGRPSESRDLTLDVLPVAERVLGATDPDVLYLRVNLATCYSKLMDLEPAEEILRDLLAIYVEQEGPRSSDVLNIRHRLGEALQGLGRHDEALVELDAALELANELRGDDVYATIIRMALAYSLWVRGEPEEASRQYVVVERELEQRGGTLSNLLAVKMNHANLLCTLGRFDEAEERYVDASSLLTRLDPEPGPRMAQMLGLGSRVARGKGDGLLAEDRALEAIGLADETVGPGSPLTTELYQALSRALRLQGDRDGAEAALREGHDLLVEARGERDSGALNLLAELVERVAEHDTEYALELGEDLIRRSDPDAASFAAREQFVAALRAKIE